MIRFEILRKTQRMLGRMPKCAMETGALLLLAGVGPALAADGGNFIPSSRAPTANYSVILRAGSDDRGGYRDLERPGRRMEERGSVVVIHDRFVPDYYAFGNAAEDGIDVRGTSSYGDNASVVTYGSINEFGNGDRAVGSGRNHALSGGPKVIDVETARLDRRSIGPSGIDVVWSGGAKIIRIAPDYSEPSSRAERSTDPMARPGYAVKSSTAVAVPQRRPEAPPAQQELRAEASTASASSDREPWSDGWRSYCSRTYASFNPGLGTIIAADGKKRFCTAD